MGHTSMCQFHTGWSHFWRLMIAVDYDGVSTYLMIILMIELGIWVIRASGNFIRVRDVFWRLLVTVENDDVSTKFNIIFIIELSIWVIRASGNFIRGCRVF